MHDESKTPSLVLYVVPTAVALSVILLMVLLILVYMKHRKGDKEDSFTVQVPTCPEISSLKSKSLGGSVQMSKEDVRETTFDGSINKVTFYCLIIDNTAEKGLTQIWELFTVLKSLMARIQTQNWMNFFKNSLKIGNSINTAQILTICFLS